MENTLISKKINSDIKNHETRIAQLEDEIERLMLITNKLTEEIETLSDKQDRIKRVVIG